MQRRFPFLKLQLLRENPCHIPDAHEWAAVVRAQAPLFPHDVLNSMKALLQGREWINETWEESTAVDACEAAAGLQLPVTCHIVPALPPPLPSAVLLGFENGSTIPAESAIAVRVFVSESDEITTQCPMVSAGASVVHVVIECKLDEKAADAVRFEQGFRPGVTFYSFKLPLQPGNYSIAVSITSTVCPALITHTEPAVSVTVVSNQELLTMEPHRIPMAVVDQIVFNACVAPDEYGACTGFTMHGDLGYVGAPRHALWSRHVSANETVLFFYQWGINKAPLFPSSVLKVLVAMESRAAEPVMWKHFDELNFDSQPPPFDFVVTHDRKLLERVQRALFVPHGGLLLRQQEVGLYPKSFMVSMVSPQCWAGSSCFFLCCDAPSLAAASC